MADPAGTMRLDRFLWFARIVKTRSQAQAMAEGGHLRLDGRRIERAHVAVRPGSVLAFAIRGEVRVIRIEALPARRGPPAEARACYADLSPAAPERAGAEVGSAKLTRLKNENVSQKGPID